MKDGRIRLWRRLVIPASLLLVLLAGVALRLAHAGDVRSRTPDEYTYVRYAGEVAKAGPAANAALFREYAANPPYWNFPSPVRVGHTLLLGAVMVAADSQGFGPAVSLSLACSVFSLALVAWMGFRFFGPPAALAGTLFLASSLVELTLARRAWQDAAFGFFALLVVCFAMEILRNPGRWWPACGLHVAGVTCVLMKQTGLIIYAICVLAVILQYALRGRMPRSVWMTRSVWMIAPASAAALLASGMLVVQLGGGWEPTLVIATLSLRFAPAAVTYARSCCEGPWWYVVWAMIRVNPFCTILAAISIASLLRIRSRVSLWNARYELVAAAMVLSLVGFISLTPMLQNLRYLSPVTGVVSLLAGNGIVVVARLAGRKRRALGLCLLLTVLLFGVAEFQRFGLVAVTMETPDLGVVQILSALSQ